MGLVVLIGNPSQAFFPSLGYNRQKKHWEVAMEITNFIPSQRQAILERFQQVEDLGFGAIRIEMKVSNPIGIIYECYLIAGDNYFSDQPVVSFRILYEKDVERISLDVNDIPGRSSLSNYLQLLNIFEALQNYLNREFSKVKNT